MIRLYGRLARDFKKKYPHADPKNLSMIVNSASEVMRAMESQYKGFTKLIRKSGFYRVARGDSVMDDKK